MSQVIPNVEADELLMEPPLQSGPVARALVASIMNVVRRELANSKPSVDDHTALVILTAANLHKGNSPTFAASQAVMALDAIKAIEVKP